MKTDNIKKNDTSSISFGKLTMEIAWADIPKLSFSSDSTREMPTLIDKENCGKSYRVKGGEIYTVRLGVVSKCSQNNSIPQYALSKLSYAAKFQQISCLFYFLVL